MSVTPPFEPPYKFRVTAPEGERWMEMLADGSQIETVAPAAMPLDLPSNAKQASAKPSGSGAGKTVKAAAVLKVPFAEKDAAKALGARWDAAKKKWYVPQGVDPAPFSKWSVED